MKVAAVVLELAGFAWHNGRWWLGLIGLALGLLALYILLTESSYLTPFAYSFM